MKRHRFFQQVVVDRGRWQRARQAVHEDCTNLPKRLELPFRTVVAFARFQEWICCVMSASPTLGEADVPWPYDFVSQ